MPEPVQGLNAHYSREGLSERLLGALAGSGKDPARLTRADLELLEEFHIRGREATRALAPAAGIGPGTGVLDVGSGIGGPARTLAAEYGARVTGLDLVGEYVRAAGVLSERVGLGDRVRFVQGSALDLPFPEASFDVVWTQHVTMNVEDKPRLLAECRRVLRPGGRLAFYEVFTGPGGEVVYPAPWADGPSISFMIPAGDFRRLLAEAGFSVDRWEDVTAPCRTWYRDAHRAVRERPPDAPRPVGLGLLMGSNAREKGANMVRNLAEARVAVIEGVARAG